MKKIASNGYYSVFSRPRKRSRYSQLLVLRRDTGELVHVVSVPTQNLSETAADFLAGHGLPADWKAPHRVCLHYCMRIDYKREAFGLRLGSGELPPSEIWQMLKRFEAFQYHLIRKVNALSTSERLLLLTPIEQECCPQTTEDFDLLRARAKLYGLFFERSREMQEVHARVAGIIQQLIEQAGEEL